MRRLLWRISLLLSALYFSASPAIAVAAGDRGRSLLAFVEAQGNTSFRCSPSGPCIPCQYSEKNDDKYRCSETGYHLPLKCVEEEKEKEKEKEKEEVQQNKNQNRRRLASEFLNSKLLLGTIISNFKWRKLLDEESSDAGMVMKQYITYRSCVPVDGEEKLSVIGFEVMMVGLLMVSGPVVYLRQKRTLLMQRPRPLGQGAASSNS